MFPVLASLLIAQTPPAKPVEITRFNNTMIILGVDITKNGNWVSYSMWVGKPQVNQATAYRQTANCTVFSNRIYLATTAATDYYVSTIYDQMIPLETTIYPSIDFEYLPLNKSFQAQTAKKACTLMGL